MIRGVSGSVAVAAFAAVFAGNMDRAAAQATDAQLEKENAALRARLHHLELESENTNLRARLGQLDPQGQAGRPSVPASTPGMADYAADMPVKALRPMPAWYSWTGFYVGGNLGYSIGADRGQQSLSLGGAALSSAADVVVVPHGLIGGVQLGYNWQGGSNWLLGFETDFQASDQKDTACGVACLNVPSVQQIVALTVEHELKYFGTARARLGVVNNGALFYVTGGGAYGRLTDTDGLNISQGGGTAVTASGSVGTDLFGWAAGAGIEAALYGNWTGKVEYLYMDLGSVANTVTTTFSGAPLSVTSSSTVRDHIVRAGLNYRIGADASGAAYGSAGAAYGSARGEQAFAAAPIYSWTGFYIGGNIGYSAGNDRLAQTLVQPTGNAVSAAEGVVSPHGVLGGGQLGYNWQGGANWLAGFEADFQGSNQSDTACAPLVCANTTQNGPEIFTVEQELQFLATLRGRVGAVSNGVLVYATGGAAFGRVAETASINFTGVTASAVTTSDQVGWVVGGGMEVALWGGWSAKAEYLYVDLGSLSNMINTASGAPP